MVTGQVGERAIARPLADPARLDFAIVERIYQPAADGPLDTAPPVAPAPPVAAPPGQQQAPRNPAAPR